MIPQLKVNYYDNKSRDTFDMEKTKDGTGNATTCAHMNHSGTGRQQNFWKLVERPAFPSLHMNAHLIKESIFMDASVLR